MTSGPPCCSPPDASRKFEVGDSSVRVRLVESDADLQAFLRLPAQIYRADPHWVPPLSADLTRALTPGRHPFWNHAERALFLADAGGRPAGRIAAIIDRNYNEYHHSRIGFFGYFESTDDPDVARALLDAAADYCRVRGMELLFGPANPSLNDEAGMLIGPFDGPPVIKMSYNPSYYPRLAEAAGLAKVKDLYAYIVRTDQPIPDKVQRVMEKLKSRPGLVVRPLNLADLSGDLRCIKEVYNDAWSQNWDFAPMTDDEIDNLARELRPIVVPELCPLLFLDGQPVGMCIGLPDYNQILIRLGGRLFPFGWLKFLLSRRRITRGRVWALGLRRGFHHQGFDSLLYYEVFAAARKLGYREGEVSWILEDNIHIIRPILTWGGRLYRTYRVYQRPL
uniref:N-acetyltransferase n=1 Tax=candidate division WOR-3 bacterium TaxID=2052148 RepID=A0A7C4GFC3_UNCW3